MNFPSFARGVLHRVRLNSPRMTLMQQIRTDFSLKTDVSF